mgnify:FL=1
MAKKLTFSHVRETFPVLVSLTWEKSTFLSTFFPDKISLIGGRKIKKIDCTMENQKKKIFYHYFFLEIFQIKKRVPWVGFRIRTRGRVGVGLFRGRARIIEFWARAWGLGPGLGLEKGQDWNSI